VDLDGEGGKGTGRKELSDLSKGKGNVTKGDTLKGGTEKNFRVTEGKKSGPRLSKKNEGYHLF